MKVVTEYQKKLLDPRWQKRRLEILKRDGWKCVNCGETEKSLHVHHKKYLAGYEPWDTPKKYLETLCGDCHKSAWETRAYFQTIVLDLVKPCDQRQVAGYIEGLLLADACPCTAVEVRDYEHAEGIGAAYGLTAEEVIQMMPCTDHTVTVEQLTTYAKSKQRIQHLLLRQYLSQRKVVDTCQGYGI
jgi:hypothetical protein